jgi:hypothetical protein
VSHLKFIKPCDGRITSPFGYRIHPIRKKREMHWGVDFSNTPKNNTIVASADGKVSFAGVMGSYGNVVMIVHTLSGETYETVYAHLASYTVKVGQSVKQSEKIGIKGTTGGSTGIHLHYELHFGRRNSSYTNAVDPLLYVSDFEVLNVQKLLNQVGCNLTEDGIYGNNTKNAIIAFQKKCNLIMDGNVGEKTLSKLVEAITASVKPKPQPKPQPPKPTENDNKEDGVRMLKYSSDTSKTEWTKFLEKAKEDGIITADKWNDYTQKEQMPLDDAVNLIATYLNRTHE